ncbi:hypothetical protein KUTeg_018598 [Tegillarca granosa]|uniref:Solute carrier family 23 member 2 n=1 Tax=Tegillarca granosa TaxID=220873 RepID=A0ABQ9EIK8_TEGGR|nr:hypothetical protein KUTeg_018598 [Tegillarca granosa]
MDVTRMDTHTGEFEGCLILVGILHFLVGATGLVGVVLKLIGPITIVPTILLGGIFTMRAVTKYSKVFWGISSLTAGIAIVLSLYLAHKKAPIPVWTPSKGCRIIWYPLHQVFSLLIAIMTGWLISAICTFAGVFTDDPELPQYLARTDARLQIIEDFTWFYIPYPGQFGPPSFNAAVFIAFIIATITSILDSIGDYYACAKMCNVPPPPSHAVNRGIATEGLCSLLSGAVGCGTANTTIGGNIGAIGVTKVASRDVFIGIGCINILLGVVGKFAAAFVTIPYPVLGGSMIMMFGMFNGVVLSNLQSVSLTSSRNLAFMGTAILVGLMIPHWIETTPDAIQTGNESVDNALRMLLANPNLACGVFACFLDNTLPGTDDERGISVWQNVGNDAEEKGITYATGLEIYDPWFPKISLSNSIAMSFLVAEVACAENDDEIKAQLLSSLFVMNGIATFFEGCLILVGILHFLVGATGLVGVVLKLIGPITIVPTILLSGIFIMRAVTKYSKVFWGISSLTAGIAIVLSLYLAHKKAPIPVWTPSKGCRIVWYPLHQVFSVCFPILNLLIAIMTGWLISAICTFAGVFTDDPESPQYLGKNGCSFTGQFGPPSFNAAVFIAFIIATITSILDSIGDYYACARMCNVPPPPSHAVNRGIATEGLCSLLSGAVGCGAANTTIGGNIGAIGVTKVASRDVFIGIGCINILLGVVGKFAAAFVTIPYPVLGGSMIMMFGMFNGVVLSNLQGVSLNSSRNLAIMGTAILVGLMIPHWIETTPDALQTGNESVDNALRMLLANPNLTCGVFACFLDNTIPGTDDERGISAWQNVGNEAKEKGITYAAGLEIYDPWLPKMTEKEPNGPTNLHENGNAISTFENGMANSQENGKIDINSSWKEETSTITTNPSVEIIAENPHTLLYNVNERTPIYLTFFFAIQQTLLSFSNSIAISFLVAEAACADKDDEIKTMLLSSILFMNGVSTFVCVLFGIRLPLFQGTCADYVVPLVAIMVLDTEKCTRQKSFLMASYGKNDTWINETLASNGTDTQFWDREVILQNLQVFEGCLMLAGVVHTLIGATGLVGFLLKFVGPITVVPTILLMAIFLTRTAGTAVILALYLAKRKAPIPMWSRQKGCYILWYPLHQVFALLIAIIVGWMVSGILTAAGVFSDDPNAPDFNARTDARADVISNFPWFYFPYPGQFGPPSFNAGVFIAFLIATITSILDSIGDYYACHRMCNVPPPPSHAVNRGIATEGLCTIIAGAIGCGVANTTTGGNVGAIGVTKVASRDVFIGVAFINICFGIIGKFGALFVTIPYPVLGGSMVIMFGMLFGIVLSNLQVVSLASTRNLAVIGSSDFDNVLRIMFANPMLSGGVMACFLDNTVSGTPDERGITAWQNLGKETEEEKRENNYALGVEVYDPILPEKIMNSRILRFLPFCPNKPRKRQGDTIDKVDNEKVDCKKNFYY